MAHKDDIIQVFHHKKRPLQATEIHEALVAMDSDITIAALRVVLVICETEGLLSSIKYQGTPKFYCQPDWVVEGVLRPDIHFNPHWKRKIKIKDEYED